MQIGTVKIKDPKKWCILKSKEYLSQTDKQGVSQKCPGAVLVDFGFKFKCNRIHFA